MGLLEARSGATRRFGPDADARWRAFRGGLQDGTGSKLLVRDASVRNPALAYPNLDVLARKHAFDLALRPGSERPMALE
jgi:hypothetical protein